MAVPNWQPMPHWQVVVSTSIVATSIMVLRGRNTLSEQGMGENGTTPPYAAAVIRNGKACADPPPVPSPGSYCVDAIPLRSLRWYRAPTAPFAHAPHRGQNPPTPSGSLSHLPSVHREQSHHVPRGNCDSAIIPIHALDPIVPIIYICRDGGTILRTTPHKGPHHGKEARED